MSDYGDRAQTYRKARRDKYTYRESCPNRLKGSRPILTRRGKEKGWEWVERFYLSCQAGGALDTVFQKYETLKAVADQ